MAAGASLVVVLATAGLLAGSADEPQQVRTATTVAPASGPAVAPLIVPAPFTGSMLEEPPSSYGELDELIGPDQVRPWWRWGDDLVWEAGSGLVLADGRRVAAATGAPGTEQEGDEAVVELDDAGLVTGVHPLEIQADADESVDLRLVGGSGTAVDVLVQRRREIERSTTGPTPVPEPERSLLRLDLATDEVTPLLDAVGDGGVATAGGRVVSVRDAVSLTEPCLLDVRSFDALDTVRSVPIACVEAGYGGLPPMVRLLALDPTGRYAAVERTTLTSGTPELSLLVVDLDRTTTTEVATVDGATPWWGVTWGADGRLRISMVTDNPELPPIDIPSPSGGPTVEVVPFRER